MTRNEQILALANDGLSFEQIARKLKLSHRNVAAGVIWRSRNPERKRTKAIVRAETAGKLAERTRRVETILCDYRINNRTRKWFQLYAAGKTLGEIAASYGLTRQAVNNVFRAHGLSSTDVVIYKRWLSPERSGREIA